tara:strand:+ start:2126 stop:2266 length:141 start_codon:yes stop_codon:yes gene_type:complete
MFDSLQSHQVLAVEMCIVLTTVAVGIILVNTYIARERKRINKLRNK